MSNNYQIIYITPDGKYNFASEVHGPLVDFSGKTPGERLDFVLRETEAFFEAVRNLE